MIRRNDELNNLSTYNGEIDYRKFFEEMELSDERTEKREEVADKLYWLFTSLFVLAEVAENELVCRWYLYENLTNIVQEYGVYDAYSVQYIDKFTDAYIEVTFRHDEEYYLSDDRALLGALNEANAICEYEELQEAIEDGCTFKIWRTEKDDKVRKTHRVLEGKKLPIEEFFEVGNERLLYPRDEVNCGDLGECSNCRCHLDFE